MSLEIRESLEIHFIQACHYFVPIRIAEINYFFHGILFLIKINTAKIRELEKLYNRWKYSNVWVYVPIKSFLKTTKNAPVGALKKLALCQSLLQVYLKN